MPANPNQRSISVSGELHARMRKRCDREGWSMRGLVESLLVDLPPVQPEGKAP